MYYHNLNVIRKGSTKLLTIKNSNKKKLTPKLAYVYSYIKIINIYDRKLQNGGQ